MQHTLILLWRVTLCVALSWNFASLAHGSDLVLYATMEGVQKELGIKTDAPEAVALKKLFEAQRKESRELLSADQKAGRTALPLGLDPALQAKYRPEVQKLLKTEQFTRLLQISWQLSGRNALLEDDVAQALSLSPQQRDKLTAARDDYTTNHRAILRRPTDQAQDDIQNIDKKHQQSLELRKIWDQRINEILTKEQQEKFEALKGKPFDSKRLSGRLPSAEILIGTQGLIGLTLMKPVLQELRIAQDAPEIAELRKLSKARRSDLSQKLQAFTPEERTSKNYVQLNDDIETKYNGELQKVLKPEQYQRVSQIRFQSWGAKALRRPDIIKALDLSEAQRERLRDLESSILIKVRNVRGADDAPREPEDAKVDAELKELKLEHDRKIQDIFTPEQQAKFAELNGKPFDLTSLEPQN